MFGRGKDQPIAAEGPLLSEVVDALPSVSLPEPTGAAEPTRADVIAAYEQVYGVMPSEPENFAIGKRLADLEMGNAEDRDIAGDDTPYGGAIELYESLLSESVSEGRDEIYYQLARGHDVAGNPDAARTYLNRLIDEHPESRYVAEARFRRGEIHFSSGRYARAASDYRYVVGLGHETPYWRNASYMLGWSEFKRAEIDGALVQFFKRDRCHPGEGR